MKERGRLIGSDLGKDERPCLQPSKNRLTGSDFQGRSLTIAALEEGQFR